MTLLLLLLLLPFLVLIPFLPFFSPLLLSFFFSCPFPFLLPSLSLLYSSSLSPFSFPLPPFSFLSFLCSSPLCPFLVPYPSSTTLCLSLLVYPSFPPFPLPPFLSFPPLRPFPLPSFPSPILNCSWYHSSPKSIISSSRTWINHKHNHPLPLHSLFSFSFCLLFFSIVLEIDK